MPTLEEFIADQLVAATEDPEILAGEKRFALPAKYQVARSGGTVDVLRTALTQRERSDIDAELTRQITTKIKDLAEALRHQASFALETWGMQAGATKPGGGRKW